MATDQQFCLRWNNHQSTLISVFDSLLENGTLVDCTLAAEGQYLKAHKVVLSACSPYLETLLSQHYEKHPIVILKDVKFSELKSMMDYMYRGEVNISQDQLGTFLKAAESLQIKGLSDNGDDARDVGSTSKKPDAPRPSVTQTRAPIESKRPAPVGDLSDTSRDGSISPSALRKRRRTRRPSNGDDPDSNLDNNVCDLPVAQSTPMPVPSAPVQSLPKQIVKTEPPPPMPDPVKKEILDPPAEPLLEPKTEYLDYMNNENSIEVEDLTLDDDDEDGLDSSMDASRPGPSHGDLSQQGGYPPWTMAGDQSGTDEIFMAAQEAVGAATGQQRDSQGSRSGITIASVGSKLPNTETFLLEQSTGSSSTSLHILDEFDFEVSKTTHTIPNSMTHMFESVYLTDAPSSDKMFIQEIGNAGSNDNDKGHYLTERSPLQPIRVIHTSGEKLDGQAKCLVEHSDNNLKTKKKGGRPKKIKRGRPKQIKLGQPEKIKLGRTNREYECKDCGRKYSYSRPFDKHKAWHLGQQKQYNYK